MSRKVFKPGQVIQAAPYVYPLKPTSPQITEDENKEEIQEVDVVAEAEKHLIELEQKQKQVKHQIESMLQDAEKRAQNIIAGAEAEKQKIIVQAKQEGFKMGQAEGIDAGRKELAAALNQVKKIEDRMHNTILEMMVALEPEIVRLILTIAQKVIYTEITLNPEIVSNVVRQALKKVTDKTHVVVKIHPNDWDVIQSHREELLRINSEIEDLVITEDERVHPGGCIIESPLDTVNAQIELQFQEVIHAFSELMGKEVSQKDA